MNMVIIFSLFPPFPSPRMVFKDLKNASVAYRGVYSTVPEKPELPEQRVHPVTSFLSVFFFMVPLVVFYK